MVLKTTNTFYSLTMRPYKKCHKEHFNIPSLTSNSYDINQTNKHICNLINGFEN